MSPAGHLEREALYGHLQLNQIPVSGIIDTGASVSCIGEDLYGQNQDTWGPLSPYTAAVQGADGEPLSIIERTQYLHLTWGSASGRVRFLVIPGITQPHLLIGMDIMVPLEVRIDMKAKLAMPTCACHYTFF